MIRKTTKNRFSNHFTNRITDDSSDAHSLCGILRQERGLLWNRDMVWTALERVGCTIPDEGAGDRSGQIDVGTENGGSLLPLSYLLVLVGHSDGSLWMGHRSTNATDIAEMRSDAYGLEGRRSAVDTEQDAEELNVGTCTPCMTIGTRGVDIGSLSPSSQTVGHILAPLVEPRQIVVAQTCLCQSLMEIEAEVDGAIVERSVGERLFSQNTCLFTLDESCEDSESLRVLCELTTVGICSPAPKA